MENDRHFMFISILILAILAMIIGEVNNTALSERTACRKMLISQSASSSTQTSPYVLSGKEEANTSRE